MDSIHHSQSSNPPSFHGIDLDTLEQELASVLHPVTTHSEQTSVATRSSVLNLFIMAHDRESQERARVISENIASMLSCRVVLFNPGVDERIPVTHPQITAACRLGSAMEPGSCIERIELSVNSDAIGALPQLFDALRIPDLPGFLWWSGELPQDTTTLRHILDGVDTLVIDSRQFGDHRQFATLDQLLSASGRNAAIADLNWERLQPWRELTARFFDISAMRWALDHVREVEIEVGERIGQPLPCQAILLGCWIGHCLEWQPVELRRTRADRWYLGARDRFGEPIRIIIRTRRTNPEFTGHLSAVNLLARHHDGRQGGLTLSRAPDSGLIRMHVKSGLESVMHHAQYHPILPDESLLVQALEMTDHDVMYDATVTHAAQVIRLIGGTAKNERTTD